VKPELLGDGVRGEGRSTGRPGWGDSHHGRANIVERARERGLAFGEALSHPDISIKCSLTLCCIERGVQEKRHSPPVKEYGFGGLGTARGMEDNFCITLQLLSPIASKRQV